MSDVHQLLEEYKRAHRKCGDADPRPYLDQVQGVDRAELAAHIDRFLAVAPRPAFDPAAFTRFRSGRDRQELVSRVLDDVTLTALVKASGIKRSELSRQLAERLGLAGLEAKVGGRLRDIENGDVEVQSVRPSVWHTLGELVGESAERVRRAAENAIGPATSGAGPMYARAVSSALLFSIRRDQQDDTSDIDEDAAVDAAFFLD